jgi:hypothetical protein
VSIVREAARSPLTYAEATAALRYGGRRGLPATGLARFGRSLGWKLLRRRAARLGGELVLMPVDSTRYFEFAFALEQLPERPRRCLDVASPRLLSLYLAARRGLAIEMLNPDAGDLAATRAAAAAAPAPSLELREAGVDAIGAGGEVYDAIWSISVVEHISGGYDDRSAMRWMWESLAPGGALIVTVPCDREFREDYTDEDAYGLGAEEQGGRHFFQRMYDEAAVRERLIAPIGAEPKQVRWFGETRPGHYNERYEQAAVEGFRRMARDPREMVDNWREFPSWDAMPGVGVCCLAFEKPPA